MRDRMKRIAVLPFSIGCVSESSIAVGANHTKKSKLEAIPSIARGQEGESISGDKMKNLLLSLPKPKISAGLQRLIKSFKSFSHHILVYKDEVEEMDIEMEIGFPTDVKHVTHIGWDGSATTNPLKGWDNLKAPEMISLPNLSLRQFELAMAAQADESLLARSSVVS